MNNANVEAVVIDNGSYMMKAGISDYMTQFKTSVGYLQSLNPFYRPLNNDVFIGYKPRNKSIPFKVAHPIENGIITDFDAMEKIWHYTFYERLRVDPSEHPVILTDSKINPTENREKMASIMFETFGVPQYYASDTGILSLYSTGNTTGTVIEIGDSLINIIPIHEAYEIENACITLQNGGRNIVESLAYSLRCEWFSFAKIKEDNFEIVRDIMEKLCCLPLNNEKITEKYEKYELPDGIFIEIDSSRFKCPEDFYCNNRIPELVYDSIMKCNSNIHNKLFSNIVLSGGITKMKGFAERIQHDLASCAPSGSQIQILQENDPEYSAMLGGDILSQVGTFPAMSISRAEFEEEGPQIVGRKLYW